ncbi:MAG: FtsX-like permease family protein, partial [Acidobacteria bacterium]
AFYVDLQNDVRVLAFTFGLSLVTVLLFGLVPALRTTRVHPLAGIKDRSALGRSPRFGRILVVAQVAISLVLLAGAGLFLRTLMNLRAIDPGFKVDNLLLFEINPEQAGYRDSRISDFYQNVSDSVARIPGVTAVAFSNLAFLTGGYSAAGVKIPGRPVLPLSPGQLTVSDSFFTTMGIPILLGREFDARDTAQASGAIVVNQSFARTYFPSENPIGKTVMVGSGEYSIIGVCRDTKVQDLRNPAPPAFYRVSRQAAPDSVVFAVRSRLPAASLGPAVRRAVASLDRGIPVTGMRTQAEQIDRLLMMERLFAGLCGAAGLLALLLSSIGLYGLIAYNAARRTSEIGLRMALGARPGDVSWSVIRQALILTITGALLGGIGAIGAGQLISGGLYGVAPYDPVTLLACAGLLLAVATLAASVPARRAAKTDPMIALRVE